MSDKKLMTYEDLVLKAELADYAPVRGCMVIRPYGYGIWENIQRVLNDRFEQEGVENACFPTLIPQSFLNREKDHVEGFSPQCAVVTHGGGKKLEEPLVLRPTSETIINEMFAKWIQTYRDLPVVINQWANVFRWELRTKIFLRTLEFLWQEGHTAHETAKEAREMTLRMLNVYRSFLAEDLGLYCIAGEKTAQERFAGADATYSVEVLLRDGKALQSGTSHDLGINFAKVFNIAFQDREQGMSRPYQTSWGVSTRLIGGLILGHQDDKGLMLPPRVASVQTVVIPIGMHKDSRILEVCQRLSEELKSKGVRVKLDDRDSVTPGWKFNEYELKGVPLRLELGKRDLDQNVVTVVDRLTLGKKTMALDSVTDQLPGVLESIQKGMFERHRAFTAENVFYPKDYKEFRESLESQGGFYCMVWDGRSESESAIQEETKATIRCLPLFDDGVLGEPKNTEDVLLEKAGDPKTVVLAKSY